MPDRKLDLFAQEHSTWLRMHDFMEQEYVYLKNRLSWLVDLNHSNDLLPWAEEFQNKLLQQEAALDLLCEDIHSLSAHVSAARLASSSYNNEKIVAEQLSTRAKAEYLETEFLRLKSDFLKRVESYLLVHK